MNKILIVDVPDGTRIDYVRCTDMGVKLECDFQEINLPLPDDIELEAEKASFHIDDFVAGANWYEDQIINQLKGGQDGG